MVAIIVKSYCGPLLTVNTVWLSKYRAVRNLQYTVLCTIVSAPKISTLLWQGTFEFTVKSLSRQSMAKQQIVLYLVMSRSVLVQRSRQKLAMRTTFTFSPCLRRSMSGVQYNATVAHIYVCGLWGNGANGHLSVCV